LGRGALSQSLVVESCPKEAHVGWLLVKGIKIKLIMGTDNDFMGCITICCRLILSSIHRESMIVPNQDFVLFMLKIVLLKILFHKLLIAKIFHFRL